MSARAPTGGPGARPLAREILLLAVASAGALLPLLGQTRDATSRELRHAEIAREMAESGDFVVPTLLGRTYHDKPPLLHAAAAGLFRAFGAPSLALARAPSVLAAFLAILCAYGIGRALSGREAAFLGSLALLGTPGFANMARVARPDMIFLFGTLLSCLGLARGGLGGRLRWFAVAGLGLGLAAITKGPVGLLLPALFLYGMPIGRPEVRRPGLAGGLAILAAAAGVAACWLAPAYARDGGAYLRQVLAQPDLQLDQGDDAAPFHWYLPYLLVEALPLVLFFPFAASDAWRRRAPGLAGVAAAALLVLSAYPKKRIHYLLPLLPFLSLAAAEALHRPGRRRSLLLGRIAVAASIVAGPVWFAVLLPRWRPAEDPLVRSARFLDARLDRDAAVLCPQMLGEALAFLGKRDRVRALGAGEEAREQLASAPAGSYLVVKEGKEEALFPRAGEGRSGRARVEFGSGSEARAIEGLAVYRIGTEGK